MLRVDPWPYFVQNLRVLVRGLLTGFLLASSQSNLDYENFHPAWSPDGEWIAFDSNRDGDFEIFVVRPDGTDIRQVTYNESRDSHPAWSPDGRWIAFESERDGELLVYAKRVVGPRGERVSRTSGGLASFSSEGRAIAFSAMGSTRPGIYVVGVDGALPAARLTDKEDAVPAWSPDGKHIAFQSNRDGHFEVYVMRSDGSDVRRLTHGSSKEQSLLPSWHPISGRIFFWRRTGDAGGDYYAMDPGGGAVERITHDSPGTGIASFSPDGERFTIFSRRDGTSEIYTLKKDGTDPRRLTFR